MTWVIIILLVIVLIVIVRFANDVKKQNNRVHSEGGMRIKYAILIDHLKAGQGEILSERASSISVGKHNMDGSTVFIITQTFQTVTVQWKVQSMMFGNHASEWEFAQNLPQDLMWDKIRTDLQLYQQNKVFR